MSTNKIKLLFWEYSLFAKILCTWESVLMALKEVSEDAEVLRRKWVGFLCWEYSGCVLWGREMFCLHTTTIIGIYHISKFHNFVVPISLGKSRSKFLWNRVCSLFNHFDAIEVASRRTFLFHPIARNNQNIQVSCMYYEKMVVLRTYNTMALSMNMAVSIYLATSRTSLLFRSESFAGIPMTCFCRRIFDRHSRLPELAQPLLAFVLASNITCGCFC